MNFSKLQSIADNTGSCGACTGSCLCTAIVNDDADVIKEEDVADVSVEWDSKLKS